MLPAPQPNETEWTADAVKLIVWLPLLITTLWLAGVKVYPASAGVNVYVPFAKPAKVKTCAPADVTLAVAAPLRASVGPAIPEMVTEIEDALSKAATRPSKSSFMATPDSQSHSAVRMQAAGCWNPRK